MKAARGFPCPGNPISLGACPASAGQQLSGAVPVATIDSRSPALPSETRGVQESQMAGGGSQEGEQQRRFPGKQ